ncbi:IS1 family transposase [Microcoleus sp. C2C3]|uniref:IS1/IS1595 family N-terminal zinc-binding domain-containing protein n=1 Tax=unclassified Microcoleus TaxID=2642155 RepID=UPI002FD5AF4D
MNCPKCNATEVFKNGRRQGRQYYKCKHCGRPFLSITAPSSISTPVRQLCLTMYLKGMGLRGMERVTEIHHTTVMHAHSKDPTSTARSPRI